MTPFESSSRPAVGSGPMTVEAISPSPELFPFAFDPRADRVRFVGLTRTAYDAASFLDARMSVPDSDGCWYDWPDVRRVADGMPVRCHFVFHTSHVGSTLMSRLVGRHPALFSVREPAVLRTLAEAHLMLGHPACPWDRGVFDEHLRVFLALWSRTFDPGQTAVIKATSFVSEMAADLLERVADARAVLMYVPPATFLKALLGGAIGDIAAAAAKRYYRLGRRLGASDGRLGELSPGECVAMSWLSEMLALRDAAARFPARTLWIDFDRFLAAPESGLTAVLAHLGAGDAAARTAEILAGPDMGRYAKAPGQRYDARVRELLLDAGEARHPEEVRKGLDWLTRAAAVPAVREVCDLAVSGQTKS